MPFVRIDLAAGKSPEYRRTIGEVVYDAMIETINVPKDDRFQVIERGDLVDVRQGRFELGFLHAQAVAHFRQVRRQQ